MKVNAKGEVVSTDCRGEDDLMPTGVSAFVIPSRQSLSVK